MSETSTQSSESSAAPEQPPFSERFSDGLQNILQKVLGTQRQSARHLKSFLNGTWLGHPLHPLITDIPIMSWVFVAAFDIIWFISGQTWAAYAAFVAVIAGLIGAVGAAVTGLTDWSDTYGAERHTGLNHALFNVVALAFYLISFILRLLAGPGDTVIAAILGFIGLISVSYAGYLGGKLVFTYGTGVNHTAWEAAAEEFEAVMPVADVEENKMYRVKVADVPVLLLRQGEQFFAISATCAHAGAPLDEGKLTGDVVECPWHGSRFCMRDGRVLTGPATVNAPRYDVRLENGQVALKRRSEH